DISLVQWQPDVRHANIMKRWRVDSGTKGKAEFYILSSRPLISPLGSVSILAQQIDATRLRSSHVLDDAAICLAAAILTPFFRDSFTKIPIPFGIPVVGDNSKACCSECAPVAVPSEALSCLWRTVPVTLYELDLAWSDLQAWMTDVRSIISREVSQLNQGQCLPSLIEFAMRFGRSSDSPMDMAYQQDTVYVDVLSARGPHLVDAPSTYQHVFDEIEQLTLCKYKARVHWGKNQNRAFTNPNCPLKDKFPRLQEILNEAKQYDPYSVFVTPVIRQMLSGDLPAKNYACAVRNECYCTEDWHCGYGHSCVPANTFGEYLVCRQEATADRRGPLLTALAG
ncbi:hypothetical protein FOA52_012054, partial [Chlamydomonas sp. UWO 241]